MIVVGYGLIMFWFDIAFGVLLRLVSGNSVVYLVSFVLYTLLLWFVDFNDFCFT